MTEQRRGKAPKRRPRARPDSKNETKRTPILEEDLQPEQEIRESHDSTEVDSYTDSRGLAAEAPVATGSAPPQTENFIEPPPSRDRAPSRALPEEEYSFQVFFDRGANQFTATCLEFPELRVNAPRREDAMEEIVQRVGDELENFRRRNEPAPVAFAAKKYPEKLELKLSRSLLRRLDMQAKADRVSVEQLLSELIALGLGRRSEERHSQPQHRQNDHRNDHRRGQNSQGQKNHGNRDGNNNNRRHQGRGNYHNTMASGENFLEYVRNLEKGNYKKR